MYDYWDPIVLSLKCSLLSAFINVPWGIFWGWIFARKKFYGKDILHTFLNIPLVLPPVLTGFILLNCLSKNSFLGKYLFQWFHIRFILDWKGALLAATVVSSPFMIQIVKTSIEKIDERYELIARHLGANRMKVFFTITLPLSWHGIVAGFFLVFSRSLGEFGATIMLAGNIPGKTQTIPLAIYSKVYLGQQTTILPLVLISILLAYLGLTMGNRFGNCQKLSAGNAFEE